MKDQKLTAPQQKALAALKNGVSVMTGANAPAGLNLSSFKALERRGLIETEIREPYFFTYYCLPKSSLTRVKDPAADGERAARCENLDATGKVTGEKIAANKFEMYFSETLGRYVCIPSDPETDERMPYDVVVEIRSAITDTMNQINHEIDLSLEAFRAEPTRVDAATYCEPMREVLRKLHAVKESIKS